MVIDQDKNRERPVVDSVKTGEFLAALRRAAGYTQQDVADYLSITNKTISKWESGAGLPEISILPAVAELYDVTVDELLAGKRLERLVEKEADEGLRGGKSEKPGKTEARRKWMENSLKERFRRCQMILWGTMLAGYAILVGLYMGLRATAIAAKVFGAIWICIWLIAEIVGVYLFWSHYGGSLTSWIEERQAEGVLESLSLPATLHRCRMKLLLPFVLAVSAVIPLLWIAPFVIPSNIPAIAGAGEFITTARQLFLEVTHIDMTLASPAGWDLAIGGLFITVGRLVKALPIVLLAGCAVWKCIDLVGRLYLKLQPQQTKKQLRKLAVSAVVFFAALLVAGEAIQAVQVVSYVEYTSQERFEENIENYLLVYNSYRESGKHNGPVLEEGVERIDNTYMDHALLGNDRYDRHKGLFAIDYDGWRTYHIDSWSERLAAKDVSLMISAVICVAGLVLFWNVSKKYDAVVEHKAEEK